MTRKERKRIRKDVRRKKNLSQKEIERLAWILARSNKRKKEFANDTFETEEGERGCFPFGGYLADIFLCRNCFAKGYCLKLKDPAKHQIILNEWEVCNEKD